MRLFPLILLVLMLGASPLRAQTETTSWVPRLVAQLDPQSTPAVVFEGTVSLPHTSVRVLTPSKQHEVVVQEVTWLERSDDHFRLQIEEAGTGMVDVLDWSIASPAHARAKLDDDAGYWVRSEGGQVRQIIVMNTAAGASARHYQVLEAAPDGSMQPGRTYRLGMNGSAR